MVANVVNSTKNVITIEVSTRACEDFFQCQLPAVAR